MSIRRGAYQVWSEQIDQFKNRIDHCEDCLLRAWEEGDKNIARQLEHRLRTLEAGKEAVYFSMENTIGST